MPKNKDHQILKLIVCKLCRDYKRVNWPREYVMAKKILEKFPDKDFWLKLDIEKEIMLSRDKGAEFSKPNTLSWYLTQEGSLFLYQQKNKLKHPSEAKKEEAHLEEEKIGEDLEIEKKPKTAFDFMNKNHD